MFDGNTIVFDIYTVLVVFLVAVVFGVFFCSNTPYFILAVLDLVGFMIWLMRPLWPSPCEREQWPQSHTGIDSSLNKSIDGHFICTILMFIQTISNVWLKSKTMPVGYTEIMAPCLWVSWGWLSLLCCWKCCYSSCLPAPGVAWMSYDPPFPLPWCCHWYPPCANEEEM